MQTISVNGADISAAAIAAESQNHPAGDPHAAADEAARALIVRELLLQESRQLGLSSDPVTDSAGRIETEEEALIRALLEDQVETPRASEEECRRYYDNNIARFRSPDIYEPSHILFAADRRDEATFAVAVAEAEAIIRVLLERPEAFESLARERSDCASRDEGGRLGQITRGQTSAEFETFLFALAEGQLCSQPVKTRYGVHVLRLDRKIPGQTLPFDAARERIAAYLEEASWRRAVAQYIEILFGRATVVGLDGVPTKLQ